jgi:uncharacterized protein (UPF0335 family)
LSEDVRSIYERWRSLEEEKKVTAEDIRELFLEATSRGLNATALRRAFREKISAENETQEERAVKSLVDAYVEALAEDQPTPVKRHRLNLDRNQL